MENLEMSEREKKVFQTGLFDDLTVQDAVTIIVLYAAQIEIENDKEDLAGRIMTFLSKDAFFNEDHSYTIARINKFVNSMGEVNPLNAIEKAAKMLTSELRHKSFTLAAKIGKATQELRTTKILESLASKLAIEKEIVDKTIYSTLKEN